MRKLFAMLLCLALALGGGAWAETSAGDYGYEVLEDGTAMITKYKGSDAELEIPAELDGYAVTAIGDYVFFSLDALTKVTVPEGVTKIGMGAFFYCTAMAELALPATLTEIGEQAFSGCKALTALTLPEGLQTIGYGAFSACYALSQVSVPASVTDIGDIAFAQCADDLTVTVAGDSYAREWCEANRVAFVEE